jgi:type IV pilus assembly protein PilY1
LTAAGAARCLATRGRPTNLMNPISQKRVLASCVFLFALVTGSAAVADDSEIFADAGSVTRQSCAPFTAPAIVTNAFDHTQTLSDVYVSLFRPDTRLGWARNIRKYRLEGGEIADLHSEWNPIQANSQSVYTYIGSNSPAAMVDLSPSSYDQQSPGMGALVHSQPAVVIYGGKPASPNLDDAVLYALMNDRFLHAIDAKTGVEQWAYIPQELLRDVVRDSNDVPKYTLDGSIRVLKYDTNGDGVIDPADNDRVILFFGQGRGGSTYYAIDVTYKKPRFMWAIGPATSGLGAVGQTWSTPAIARVNISGARQNSQKLVLIFGGGYDTRDESVPHQAEDTRGNAIYMVDALKGTVLWSAGSSSADLVLARMDHAIPSDVTVLDVDGDGYADRMYVGDMGAQLWRFDIFNGNAAAELVAGGVIASLGTHDDAAHTNAAARRFYNAPDVAAIRRKGVPAFFNIAIGSGYRGHPLDTEIQDRFYAIRDFRPFDRLTQKQYDDPDRKLLQDKDLVDVSANVGASTAPVVSKSVAARGPGWKLLLNMPRTAWVGEKVLASAATFNGQILFPTYNPGGSVSSDCKVGVGANRIYSLDVFDGSGQYTALSQGGIAPQVVFLFGDGGNSPQSPHYRRVACMSGTELLGVCSNYNPLVRTYWSESNAR